MTTVVQVPTKQQQMTMPIVSAPPILRSVGATRGLGITSIVLGAITVALGIAVLKVNAHHWASKIGAGVWCGGWMIVTGIIGVISSTVPSSGILNCLNMALNIIATFITFIDGIFFVVAIIFYDSCSAWYYSSMCVPDVSYGTYEQKFLNTEKTCYSVGSENSDTSECYRREVGLGLYSALLICMVVEWFVALVAATFCCTSCCSCCCRRQTPGIILQQPQPASAPVVITTSSMSVTSRGHQDYGYPMQPVSYAQQPTSNHPANACEQSRSPPAYELPPTQHNFPTQSQADAPYVDGHSRNLLPPYPCQ